MVAEALFPLGYAVCVDASGKGFMLARGICADLPGATSHKHATLLGNLTLEFHDCPMPFASQCVYMGWTGCSERRRINFCAAVTAATSADYYMESNLYPWRVRSDSPAIVWVAYTDYSAPEQVHA